MGWLGSLVICWLTVPADEQGVCGFRVGESDTAFLLCELHQLMRGGSEMGRELNMLYSILSKNRKKAVSRLLPESPGAFSVGVCMKKACVHDIW